MVVSTVRRELGTETPLSCTKGNISTPLTKGQCMASNFSRTLKRLQPECRNGWHLVQPYLGCRPTIIMKQFNAVQQPVQQFSITIKYNDLLMWVFMYDAPGRRKQIKLRIVLQLLAAFRKRRRPATTSRRRTSSRRIHSEHTRTLRELYRQPRW